MSIKIGTKIEKLSPSDNYKLIDKDDVEGIDTLETTVNSFSGDISSLQSGQSVLQSNINQKIEGIHVEDTHGNDFDDITGIKLEGGTFIDDGVSQTVTMKVNPSFAIAKTGESSGFDVQAIEFTGDVTVGTKQTDPNVGLINITAQQGTNGIEIEQDGGSLGTFETIEIAGDLSASEDPQDSSKVVVTATIPSGGSGVTLDNNTSNIANVTTIELPTSGLLAKGSGVVAVTPYTTYRNEPSDQFDNLSHQLVVQPPLKTFSDPNVQGGGKLQIDPSAYEPQHAPNFLAYIAEDEIVNGKLGPAKENTRTGHDKGAIWFDNVIKAPGPYIETNRDRKAYGIQEADQLDPNVTGGTDYLIVFRVHMSGTAPDDGTVRAYLYNASIDPFDPTGYLEDVNGQPLVFERKYKADDELGVIEVAGIVNAKGLQEFTCHVLDDFASDNINMTDRTEGATGLLIQSLTSTEKTGRALLQFEADTGQNIEFSSHYLGPSRATLGYLVRQLNPVTTIPAGTTATSVEGWYSSNINGLKSGTDGTHLIIQDDGTNVCDFAFGKVFSAEETQMLRGKDVKVTVTLTDKDDAYNVALMKWTGKPDEFTPSIYTSRNNGSPQFATGWVKAGDLFISEVVVVGDHTVDKTFTIPTDANNYGLFIYPVSAQIPITLKLKAFTVDVVTPFTGYALKAPELIGEAHLEYSEQYKKFVQNTQGYASLRYTINNAGNLGLPMPCGTPSKGAADVSIDTSVNQVSGSSARGGEGGVIFNADGRAVISTSLNVWSEKSSNVVAQTTFWWAKVGPGDQLIKIQDSEYTAGVRGGTQAVNTMPTFGIDVDAGDVIVLRATSDQADGAFLECNNDKTPLVETVVNFKELSSTANDASDDPFADLDFGQFDTIYNNRIYVEKVVTGSAANFPISIPSGFNLAVLGAVKDNNGVIRPSRNLDYSYSNGSLSMSFGESGTWKILLGIYL